MYFIKQNENGAWMSGTIISEQNDVFVSFSEDANVSVARSVQDQPPRSPPHGREGESCVLRIHFYVVHE